MTSVAHKQNNDDTTDFLSAVHKLLKGQGAKWKKGTTTMCVVTVMVRLEL